MVVLNRDYPMWPTDPEERRRMAREIWGRDLVSAYNSWLKQAQRMLFKGERLKRPSPEENEVQTWIDSMSPEEREGALSFAKFIAEGVIFSILTELDNCTAGSWIAPAISQYRLLLNIYSTDEGFLSREPTESIDLQSREDLDFHDEWLNWLNRYSEFGSITNGLE